jgi:hypothetical protein
VSPTKPKVNTEIYEVKKQIEVCESVNNKINKQNVEIWNIIIKAIKELKKKPTENLGTVQTIRA